MKLCSRCKVEKEETEFTKDKTRSDGLHLMCKACKREHQNGRYAANPDYKVKRQAREQQRAKEFNALVNEAKSGGCIKCGESELCCLDFHHIDGGTKEGSIAERRNASLEWVRAEIEKCVVLCSNCHRKVHNGVIQL